MPEFDDKKDELEDVDDLKKRHEVELEEFQKNFPAEQELQEQLEYLRTKTQIN